MTRLVAHYVRIDPTSWHSSTRSGRNDGVAAVNPVILAGPHSGRVRTSGDASACGLGTGTRAQTKVHCLLAGFQRRAPAALSTGGRRARSSTCMSSGAGSRLVVVAGASSQRGGGQQAGYCKTMFHVHDHSVSHSTWSLGLASDDLRARPSLRAQFATGNWVPLPREPTVVHAPGPKYVGGEEVGIAS